MNPVLESGENSRVQKVFVSLTYLGNQEVIEDNCHDVNREHENKPNCHGNSFASSCLGALESRILEISDAASEHVDIVGGILVHTQ